MERKTIEENKNGARDYAVLVGLKSPVLGVDSADEESLAELSALVETAGGQSVGMILQSREKPDPHSFIGEGKVEEVKRMVENSEATMVIFDNDLSPSQVRVLTELCGVQVLDRSGLILDIFAQRARTKEGCLQVELAQYQYLLPRLIGMWSHLERQGGTGGSPIGTKGPGGRTRYPWWPSWATPTPASPRCSTPSPALTYRLTTGFSTRWTPPPGC